jgi:hypothetical protein
MILPLVFYECKTELLNPMETMRVFENKRLTKIFALKTEKVTG